MLRHRALIAPFPRCSLPDLLCMKDQTYRSLNLWRSCIHGQPGWVGFLGCQFSPPYDVVEVNRIAGMFKRTHALTNPIEKTVGAQTLTSPATSTRQRSRSSDGRVIDSPLLTAVTSKTDIPQLRCILFAGKCVGYFPTQRYRYSAKATYNLLPLPESVLAN